MAKTDDITTDYKQKVRDWHDKYAEEYDHSLDSRYDSLLALNLEGKTLINFGSGSGVDTLAFLDKAMTIVGLDFSSLMIEEANKKNVSAKAIFRECDFTKSLQYYNCFDIAYSFSTLYYVKDVLPVLENMQKALLPNGYAVIEMANESNLVCSKWDKSLFDVPQFHLSVKKMLELFQKAGFRVINQKRYKLHPFSNKEVKVFKDFAYKIVWVLQKC